MGRLEIFSAVGGSVGLIYAAGYLVLAGHYRVMGVPVPSVDSTVLMSSAWDFLFQGTLLALQRAVQSQLGLPSVIVLVILVPAIMLGRHWFASVIGRRLPHRVMRVLRKHGPAAALVSAILFVLALEGYTIVRYLVPAGAVGSVLSGQRAASPFDQIKEPWHEFLYQDFTQLRDALIGDGSVGSVGLLRRLYTSYLLSVLVTLIASTLLWKRSTAKLPRGESIPVLICVVVALLLAAHAPFYYGVALKSYRYPRVQMWPSSDEHLDGLVARELKDSRASELFFLGASNEDYYLYDEVGRKITVIRRDLVGIVKFTSEQFIFRGLKRGTP